ncbi:MAG TPA: GDSL-type esterase/lipase family protein [Candidatus Saccharimonadales bacterium]|nr:GDSL-type esterase/lipase family protein [Candidatus Saccharimonadales bacterium]
MAQILAFGDSITDGAFDIEGGWASRLQRFFMAENTKKDPPKGEHFFYNLGISGNTTDDLLERIEVEAKARKVARPDKKSVFIFAIGTNDGSIQEGSDETRVPLKKFQDNLNQLITFAKKYTDKILIVGLLPVVEEYTQPEYTNERVRQFDETLKRVAEDSGAAFLELFKKMQQVPKWEQLFDDGLHPTTEGHAWMFQQVQPKLVELLVEGV